MKFAINLSNLDIYSNPHLVVELARDAERAGWDGFFIWDMLLYDTVKYLPAADPWITLAAVAATTHQMRIGPIITALPRRRPWKVAREAVTLDHLSNGRVTLGVGLGFQPHADFTPFGEERDDKARAAKLDEGLAIMTGLWSGQPFSYHGQHYHLDEIVFLPQPVQTPRIPIWLTGLWPNKRPFRRAAQWDGIFPSQRGGGWITPDEVKDSVAYIRAHRQIVAPIDVVYSGETPGDDPVKASDIVALWQEAGVTWWLEFIAHWRGPLDEMQMRIRQGPPRL
jgi:alkanesulfonate monooxygenase SsuD/methylene tetrahydromethanopterin reductase-like flavin-dependent oxidoreductase (luciferase family)